MTKQEPSFEEQIKTILEEDLQRPVTEEEINTVVEELQTCFLDMDFPIITAVKERLANEEQLSSELGGMWEKYLSALPTKDFSETFLEKIEEKIHLSDVPPDTKEQYLKILDFGKKQLAVSKQEENVPGKDGPKF